LAKVKPALCAGSVLHDHGVDDRAGADLQNVGLLRFADLGEVSLAQCVIPQQVTELRALGGVGRPVSAQVDAHEAATHDDHVVRLMSRNVELVGSKVGVDGQVKHELTRCGAGSKFVPRMGSL
jgi:hypothetical protein